MYMASPARVCVCFQSIDPLSVFGREEAIHRARALGLFAPRHRNRHRRRSGSSTLMGRDYFGYKHQSGAAVRNQSAREAD